MNTLNIIKPCTILLALTCTLLSHTAWAKNVKITGDLMIDHDTFESGFLEDNDGSDEFLTNAEIRRARLSFKTELSKDWKAKLKVNFSSDSAEIKDAYIKYQGWQWADITIGQQKEGFGLEKQAHSRDALLIERSLVTTALTPGRSIGINLTGNESGDESSYNWQIGYFQPDEDESTTAITGRFAWLPWRQKNELVHIGFGFSERDLNGSEFRINEKMEVHTSDSLIEGDNILADRESLQGLEFLWQQSGFTAMAEWQQAKITDTLNTDYDYQGGYLQVSYQLSGENRKYKKGELGKVMTPGWEFTSRYSQFSLESEAEEAKIYSVGVNYTVNKHVKFMANFINAQQFDDTHKLSTDNAVTLRAQYTF